jgi:lipopolysaccharide transport system ATP-binding protein
MTTAIKVENLSKAYQLGTIGTGTISRDIHRWWTTKILGNEDPFLKIGETNDRSTKGTSDIVWSLKDINFEIEQGDAVGIIGKNGAGKSTLLKLLSRVTAPTTGSVKVKGRVASLLEVGTGFHPELTGRENIYLNGAILGMRKKEITRKMEEIVDFSGVERYIDTPVKRYSSGMYVRLAFAVAAHLESEILIVDEVLAVGDAEFQKKCLGKMGEVSQGEGRTVLFVSHNMAAIQRLCNSAILLIHGNIKSYDNCNQVVSEYTRQTDDLTQGNDLTESGRSGNQSILFTHFEIINDYKQQVIITGQSVKFRFYLQNTKPTMVDKKISFAFAINDSDEKRIIHLDNEQIGKAITYEGNFNNAFIDVEFEKFPLNKGNYTFALMLMVNGEISDWLPLAKSFSVTEGDFYNSGKIANSNQALFFINYSINSNEI